MSEGYGQFCPIAKAAEIFATRWTPLVLRELITGARAFNEIHRGVPLMSRALLAERLRQLEHQGIVEKRLPGGKGHAEYWLTPAGDAFRPAIDSLGRWGAFYARDTVEAHELDPGLFMWTLRKRVKPGALPSRRVILRFEFSGVAASRTKLRLMWLVLKGTDADICMKDPGYPVDVTLRGDIAVFVAMLLGHVQWKDKAGEAIAVDSNDNGYTEIGRWFGL